MLIWYALRTKPRKELHVAEQLMLARIPVYLPVVRLSPAARREEPFFPGYLFAQADLREAASKALHWTPGLIGPVEFGGEPAPIADDFVLRLRRRLEQIRAAGGLILNDLHPGDSVTVVSGPLAGYEALFDCRLSSAERVRILLTLVEPGCHRRRSARQWPVEINVDHIRRTRPGRV